MGAEESNRSYVKESCLYAAGQIARTQVISAFAFIWTLAIPKFGWCLVIEILLFAFLVYLLIWFTILAINSYRKIFNGSFDVAIVGDREITIKRNDFQLNMDNILSGWEEQALDDFVFIMGIDKRGNLGDSSGGGVVRSVFEYLNANYYCANDHCTTIIPQDSIQAQLNDYLKQKRRRKTLAYGECVNIDLRLYKNDSTEGKKTPKPCHLVLVANSYRKRKNGQEVLEDGGMSSKIVPFVFDYLHDARYTSAMIGVMGTNVMFQRYQVIFSQIINQFARLCYSNETHLKNLYISIRENDYEKSKVTLSQLVKYVRQCADYYARWNEA